MESGKEQNYWPGFVDALSNVVLTLVFVLVIFVFALVMASNKVEKRMQEVIKASEARQNSPQEATQDSLQEIQDLRRKLAAVTSDMEKMRLQQESASMRDKTGDINQAYIEIENKDPKPRQSPVLIRKSSDDIVLEYPLQTSEMDEKSASELKKIAEPVLANAGKRKIVVRSIIGKEVYSAAKRLAYYRAINVRNFFITQMGQSPANIVTRVVQPNKPENGRVEITVEKQ